MLACATEQDMGKLPLGTPIPFQLKEETDHFWDVELQPNTTYEIVVYSKEGYTGTQIVVMSEGNELANGSFYDNGTANLKFRTQETGKVRIKVSSTANRGNYIIVLKADN